MAARYRSRHNSLYRQRQAGGSDHIRYIYACCPNAWRSDLFRQNILGYRELIVNNKPFQYNLMIIVVIVTAIYPATLFAQSSVGLNYTFINGLSDNYGLSQIFCNKKLDIINNCGIIIIKDKPKIKFYDYFFDGFSIQTMYSYRFINSKYLSAAPFLSCLIYGTFNFDKRICLSTGIQTSLIKKLNISIGILEAINPHLLVDWDFYIPALMLSISVFFYQFKENKWPTSSSLKNKHQSPHGQIMPNM
jgi:hypothetical protein